MALAVNKASVLMIPAALFMGPYDSIQSVGPLLTMLDIHYSLPHALLPLFKYYTNSIFCKHLLLLDVSIFNPPTVLNPLIRVKLCLKLLLDLLIGNSEVLDTLQVLISIHVQTLSWVGCFNRNSNLPFVFS